MNTTTYTYKEPLNGFTNIDHIEFMLTITRDSDGKRFSMKYRFQGSENWCHQWDTDEPSVAKKLVMTSSSTGNRLSLLRMI